jgi:hypothetical protein
MSDGAPYATEKSRVGPSLSFFNFAVDGRLDRLRRDDASQQDRIPLKDGE